MYLYLRYISKVSSPTLQQTHSRGEGRKADSCVAVVSLFQSSSLPSYDLRERRAGRSAEEGRGEGVRAQGKAAIARGAALLLISC